jgi:hypothetical protein
VEEALVFLDRHGRYVTASTAALAMLGVADHELASFSVARTLSARRQELADWGALAERGPGIGESLLVSPAGRQFQVTVVVTHIATGWQITLEPLDRPAREPGIVRKSPEILAAWRGAERRLAEGGEAETARDVERLRRQYGQLAAHLAAEAGVEIDDASSDGSFVPGPDPSTAMAKPATAET